MNKQIISILVIIIALVVTGVAVLSWQQQNADSDNQATNSATPSTSPVVTANEENKPSASETPQPVEQTVQLFLVSLEDTSGSNTFGCGDSLVGVNQTVTTSTPLAASIQALLAINDQYYGQSGLYNALWQSNLNLVSATISNGVATVALSGTLQLSGTCDSPRIEEQLKATITQFSSVNSATITLNGQPLSQTLSTQ